MVKLVSLGEDEYRAWYAWLMEDYAGDIVRTGVPEEIAKERARADIEQGLPEGLQSKDQYLYSIQDEQTGEHVGVLWFALNTTGARKVVFIYDIVVYEQHRGKGFGKQAMLALEDKARELGAARIGLHVFAHNLRARELYKRLGYRETNVNMVKDL